MGAPQWRDKSKLWCTVKDCESPARHESTDCFAYGGGKQGQYPVWYRGPRDIHLPKAQREARKMRPRVHQVVVESTTTSSKVANNSNQTQSMLSMESRSHMVTSVPLSDDKAQINHLFEGNPRIWMTRIEPGVLDNECAEVATCTFLIVDRSVGKSDDCYHDSGANRHVFHSREVFAEFSDIAPVRIHAFSEGLSIAAARKGMVKLHGTCDDKTEIYTLTNCLYIPGAHANPRFDSINSACLPISVMGR
jgi:hypothetical protein